MLEKWTNVASTKERLCKLLAAVVTMIVVSLGAEVLVRVIDPQEVRGWGERPSLQVHGKFGWHLVPARTTRLRWGSYDYVVESNQLGFPGPLYPPERTPGSVRVLTLGDAFTSAEGVDTDQAWPRVLEGRLRERLAPSRVEVLNFAVTGYGPNQYAAVLDEYGPIYRPDVVLIGFSVNDYFDVLVSNGQFHESIGVERSGPDFLLRFFQVPHLRKWVHIDLWEPMLEAITRSPRPHGYFLGDFRCLEAGSKTMTETGFNAVTDRLSHIRATADTIGSTVIIAIIPAPVQVCEPHELAWYPRAVDLANTSMFDPDQPQRLTQRIAHGLGIATYDLRDVLCGSTPCPYYPRNRHWLPAGHELVARFLCDALVEDGHARPSGTREATDNRS